MNARDLQTRTSKETRFEKPNLPKESRNKISFWDRISNLSLNTTADRIKFLFVFVLIGLGVILIGDVLKLIPLKGTGVAFQIMGWLLIAVGFSLTIVSQRIVNEFIKKNDFINDFINYSSQKNISIWGCKIRL